MTTVLRREPVPHRANEERIVVGPSLFSATNGPTARKPHAVALYVFPDEGAAMLGSARSPAELLNVIEQGVARRPPEAIWLRDVPWFVDAWGVRSTGRLERGLADVAAGRELVFVSWLEGNHGGKAGQTPCRSRSSRSRAPHSRGQ